MHLSLCLCSFLMITSDVTLSSSKISHNEVIGKGHFTNSNHSEEDHNGEGRNDNEGVVANSVPISDNIKTTKGNKTSSRDNSGNGSNSVHTTIRNGQIREDSEPHITPKILTPLPIGTIVTALKNDCGIAECNLGDFLLNSYLDHIFDLRGQSSGEKTVVILNGGALRKSIPAGKITEETLKTLVEPIEMGSVDMKGSDIRNVIEKALWEYDGKTAHGEFLQISGMTMVIDPSKKPGQRLQSVRLNTTNDELKNNTYYTVVMSIHMWEKMSETYKFDTRLDFNKIFKNILDIASFTIAGKETINVNTDGRIKILNNKQEPSPKNQDKTNGNNGLK